MKNDLPGPRHRLGVLVPSSNSNAESSIARMLANQHDIGVHYSRFTLPPDLDLAIDRHVLGQAPSLLSEVEPAAVAFHGTSGSWKGLGSDRALCSELADVVGAPVTTASLAVVEALTAHDFSRLGLIFPGPSDFAEQIVEEYRQHGLDVTRVVGPSQEMTNSQIAWLSGSAIEEFAVPVFSADVDAVVCIGTNMRTAYLVAAWEQAYGVPVIDSATATLWHLMRLAEVARPVKGWGSLLGKDIESLRSAKS